MATVTSYTAARMQEIEDSAVVGGHITGDNLILERFDGSEFTAGNVRGPEGPTGPAGSVSGALGSTDNAIIRTDGVGGSLAQGSAVTIDDSGRLTSSLMSVTTAPSVSNDVVNKTYADKSGKGVLGYKTNSTDTSLALSSFVTVNGMSITITPEVGRYYRFSTNVHFLAASATGNCRCAIGVFRSTDLSNAIVQSDVHLPSVTGGAWAGLDISQVFLIPAGWGTSTTFLVRALVDNYADCKGSSFPQMFSIEDVGAP